MDYVRCMSHADPYGSGGGEDSADEDDDKPSIPTASCRWYPNPLNFGSCVYSPHYPPQWDADKSTAAMFLYETHGDCCLGAYLQDRCGEELACGDDATGSSGGGGAGGGSVPSGSSSIVPTTLYPTFNPTGDTEPTERKPTRQPTTRPEGWDISRDDGNGDDSEDEVISVPSPAAPAGSSAPVPCSSSPTHRSRPLQLPPSPR
ncbi:hypothetical protein THAOC_13944, partial [Thalassiosira oceanica]